MTHKFLKIAGVKDEASFYKKFPTEDAFFKAHPDAHPSYAKGGTVPSKDINTGEFLNTRLGLSSDNVITPLPTESSTGGCTDAKGNPIPCPPGVKAGTVIVTNPNDPRLKAYNDSLSVYKMGQRGIDYLKNNKNPTNKQWKDFILNNPTPSEKSSALSIMAWPDKEVPFTTSDNQTVYVKSYKKPVQPVVYQKPQQSSKPEWTGKKMSKEEIKNHIKGKSWQDKITENNWIFENPTKPQERKDYPIVTHPKAQAKINITSPQPYTDPVPQGDYIYGPANSVIGINSKDGFVPWSDDFDPTSNKSQRGKVNKADLDMLNNPEAMKKYVKGKGLKIKGAWGASLGTDPYIGGPDPIKLDLNGKPLTGVNTTPSAGLQNYQPITMPTPIGGATGFPNTDSPAFTNYPTLGTTSLPPSNPYMSQAIPMDPKQTGYKGPQQGQGALNSGQVPITPEADKNAIPIKKEAKKLSMPDGAASGGFTGQGILAGLEIASALMPPDKIRRRYVRPEDMQSYNPNQYGTGSQAISEYGSTLKGKKKKAFWGALIGVAVDKAKEVKKGIHQNIENAVAPILNIANNNAAEAARLDNLYLSGGVQDVSKLQPVQPLLPQQPQYPQYMAHGGEMKYNNGGELLTGKEGKTELKSYNHFDGGTFQFNGPQHSEGGISIDYKGSPAEVEGGETAFKDQQGDLKIMGNLIVPGTNMKYKAMSKLLSEKEKKAQKYIDRGSLLLNTASPTDPYEAFSFNSGKAMAIGGLQKQKQIAAVKEHLGNMQEAHLELAKEKGTSPNKLFKNGGTIYEDGGTAGDPIKELEEQKKYFDEILKNPKKYYEWEVKQAKEFKQNPSSYYKSLVEYNTRQIKQGAKDTFWKEEVDSYNEILSYLKNPTKSAQKSSIQDPTPKKWQYKGTNVKNLDPKIQEFVSLLEKKGITGYSGEQGGFRKGSMTKSGNRSRHASNQALDLIPVEGEAAYQKILKDPELTSFLLNNGLTAINEYSSDNAKQTGATAGHIHIGRDRGTKLSDQFRNEAASLYPDKFKPISGNYKTPIITSLPGDAQTENFPGFVNKPYEVPPLDYTPRISPIQTVQGSNTPINLQQPAPYNKPSNARGISPLQFAGEALALTDKVEPVQAQQYFPDLYQPYQVSFQDRLNENNANFNNVEKQLAYDPTSLSTLSAQRYGANSSVLGEEFRTNQAIANDITNKNVSLLNEAKKTNLSILDTQFVRQDTAKSKTRARKEDAISSISSKMIQKEASNNALRVYENLYPDYAFNNKTGRAQYYGPDAASQIDWGGLSPVNQADRTKIETKKGPVKTTQYYDDPTDQFMKSLNIQKKRNDLYTPKNMTYFLKNK